MKKKGWIGLAFVSLAMIVMITGCQFGLERNADGSWRLESEMTEESLAKLLEPALADPQIQELAADIREGYVFVSGARTRDNSKMTDTLSLRLDLGAENGIMTVVISEARLNDIPIEQSRVDKWNADIAASMMRSGQRNPNSTLESVSAANDRILMVWRIERANSSSK